MYSICSNSIIELSGIKVSKFGTIAKVLVLETTIEIASILITVINAEVAKIKANFLAI